MNDEYETKMAVIERNNYCEDLCEEPEQRQESDLFLIEGEEEFTQVSLEYELSCQSCEIRPPCHDKYNYQPNQEINNVYASMVEVDPITEEILNYVAHFKYRIDWSSFKPTKGNVDVGVHPGRHYKLITYAKEGHCSDVRINAKWKNTSIFTNELGGYNYTKLAGGVRIKKITDNDGNKDTRSRSFRYGYFDAENNYHSYGQLHVPYLYTKLFLGREFVFEMASETFDPCDLDNQLVCWQLMRMTRSQYPMSISPSGSTVGYTKVEINENDSQESGKTIHEYINWPTYFPEPDEEEPFHPYFKEVIPSSSNGLLNRVTIYQFDIDKYIKVKETVFKYIQLVNDWYPGLKIFKYNPCRSYAAFCFFDMYFSYSAMNSSLFRQSSITENIYVNNISAFSTKKEFQYENSPKHYQIVQEKELKSDGSIFTTNYKYPLDFTEDYLGSNLLKENHIHNKPIEIESNLYRNDSTVNLLRKNVLYSGFGKYVLPSRVVHYYENNVDRKSIVNYKYSQATGKLLSMQKDSDKVLSFIFGYDNQYPITQIENAAYSEVEAALGSEFILEGPGGNTLSTNQINSLKTALPNALVTTYTYEPLIGMTSQTDPNGRTTVYEYDGFGRLKAVKQQGASDPEAEMVKTYEYNYQK
jgi:YD repeat-containing protein